MPSELLPTVTGAGGVLSAIGLYFYAPTIKGRIEARARRETHDQAGWTTAVESLKAQVGELREEVHILRARVVDTEKQLSERDQRIGSLETMVADQSTSLVRSNARVRQLESSWPTQFSMPAPDPGYTA